MEFGLHIADFTWSSGQRDLGPALARHVRNAEAAGIQRITVMDHFWQLPGIGPVEHEMLEAYATLGFIAAHTEKAMLHALVTGVIYRHPALLAKQVTTLDVLSGGRAILGLGAAWNEEEHEGYGFDFPPIRERMDRLDEALAIIHAMFVEDRPSFSGTHYRIHEALNVPKPIQPAGPPIMVGGGGEQRTLRIAARHADLTHWFPLGLETLRHKDELLVRYCEEIGRDPGTIERTMASPVVVAASEADGRRILEAMPPERRAHAVVGTPEQAADGLRPYLDAGFSGFTFNNSVYRSIEQIELIAEVLRLIPPADVPA